MKTDVYDKFADTGIDVNNLSEEDINCFKRVFTSDDGQYVLCMILDMCKFMEQCDNKCDMAQSNFAKKLMTIVYWDKERKYLNTHRIIDFIKNKLKRSKRKNG